MLAWLVCILIFGIIVAIAIVSCAKEQYSENVVYETGISDRKSAKHVHIIVPFRDQTEDQVRTRQLRELLTFFKTYLTDKHYHIYVIEQSEDARLFNKGVLMNYGFQLAEKSAGSGAPNDLFVFHDVDMHPDEDLKYWYTTLPRSKEIFHLGDRHSRHLEESGRWFGAVVMFRADDYTRINGYPNDYWGWGGEDNDLYERALINDMIIVRPQFGILYDQENFETYRDKYSYLQQNELLNPNWESRTPSEIWHKNGVNSVRVDVVKQTKGLKDTRVLLNIT